MTRENTAPALPRKRVSLRPAGSKGILVRGFRRPRLSVNLAATSGQVVAALNANAMVMASVNALTLTELPTLKAPPPWWTTFTTAWTAAQTSALEWVQSIGPDFTLIPQSIANYNALFQSNVQIILSACAVLEQNPNDAPAIAALNTALNALLSMSKIEQDVAAQFAGEIDAFSSQLVSSATNMNAALQQALHGGGADWPLVQNLQTEIEVLQAQIGAYDQLLSTASAGQFTSIYLMCSGITLAFASGDEPGFFVLGAGVFGLSPAILSTINNNPALQASEQQIFAGSVQLSEVNQQMSVVNVLVTSLNDLIALINTAQSAVAAMSVVWSAVQDDLNVLVMDLRAAQQPSSNANWQQIAADVIEAQAEWNALQELVGDLAAVDFNASGTIQPIPPM